MYGVKIYDIPQNISKTVSLWKSLGFDTVMIKRECIHTKAFISAIEKAGIMWSIIEPVFLAPEGMDESRLSRDINGSPVIDDWVRFMCPTDSDWMDSVIQRISSDSSLNPGGISLDFLRFFQFWERIQLQTHTPPLVQTCFCPRCKKQQKEFPTIAQWRISVITNTAIRCIRAIKAVNPDICIGIHLVPWLKSTFNGAREQIIGQDIQGFMKYVDYVTPMIYHHMIGEKPAYSTQVISSLNQETENSVAIIPSIQVKECYTSRLLGLEEFEKTLEAALTEPSAGVIFYQWSDIEENPEIQRIIKKNKILQNENRS